MYNNGTCPLGLPGLWNNGDCSLLCRKAEWYDILIFFLGNYAAHVATVGVPPGTSLALQALYLTSALFFPLTGLLLGLKAINSRAIFAPTSLQQAARAGALWTVVPLSDALDLENISGKGAGGRDEESVLGVTEWRTLEGDTANGRPIVTGAGASSPQEQEVTSLEPRYNGEGTGPALGETGTTAEIHRASDATTPYTNRAWLTPQFHGECDPPMGYTFTKVPSSAEFDNDEAIAHERWWHYLFPGLQSLERQPVQVACNHNIIKILVSMVQIVYSVVTLYKARGNEIERYGYAAFGLTVLPYACMSVVNLLGALLRPSYPSLYITGSKWLDEARSHNSTDSRVSTIGRLTDDSAQKAWEEHVRSKSNRPFFGMTKSPEITRLRFCATFYARTLGLACLGIGIPVIVIGAISRFSDGRSTLAQRSWIMSWLIIGGLSNALQDGVPFWNGSQQPSRKSFANSVFFVFAFIAYSVPAWGGFVVVAQMIAEHGVCTRLPT